MKIFGGRIRRFVVLSVLAAVGMLTVGISPALAQDSARVDVTGVSGAFLGYGQWVAAPSGSNLNGLITVHDDFCDGDNGIIASLWKNVGGTFVEVNKVSVRGCGQSNTNNIKSHANGGPAYGELVLLLVCKLLPNGDWKDCRAPDHDTYNW